MPPSPWKVVTLGEPLGNVLVTLILELLSRTGNTLISPTVSKVGLGTRALDSL